MRRLIVMLALLCTSPGLAAAQEPGTVVLVPPRSTEKVWLVVDVGMTPFGGGSYSNEYATPNVFVPSAWDTMAVTYHLSGAFATGYGAGYMVTPRFGVGVSRTRVSHDDVIARTAVSRPRLIRRNGVVNAEGVVSFSEQGSSHHTERAYHLEVSGHVVRTRLLHVRAFAGPSRFTLLQGQIRELNNVAYPVEQNGVEAKAWGYNFGVDVAAYIPSRYAAITGIGFGASARYASAEVVGINGLDPAAGRQTYPVGGLVLALGMRGRF
jgi:hypothetical protein